MKNTPLLLALSLLLLFSCKDEKQQEMQQDVTTEKPDLIADSGSRKVFSTDNLNMQTFTLDAGKDNTIKGEKGTELTIPKNTFTDAQGNVVTGTITVQLKEALSISDIVTGGLTTTSNGEILSSGGMLYINVKQGDADVVIGGAKSIGVSVPTDNFIPEMQIFTGEEDADGNINWVKPKDIIKKPVAKQKSSARVSSATDVFADGIATPVKKPLKPKKNDGGIVIAVNIDNPELLPEFMPFNNVSWKLVDDSAFSKEDNETDWKHVSVKRSDKEGIYVLTFKGTDKNKDEIKEYDVYPVLEGEEYDIALADYNKKLVAYEKEKELQEQRRKEQLKKAEEWRKEQQLINEERKKALVKEDYNAAEFGNRYIFEVTRLRWINCDYFYRNRNATDVLVRATINNTSENNVYAYLVIKKNKVCLPGYPDENGNFMFGGNGNTYISMPLGIEVTIIGVSPQEDGTLRFDSRDVTVTKETSVSLELKQATQEDMKKAIEVGTINS